MNRWRSIELRLTAWYALMLFAGFLAFSLVSWMGVRYSLSSGIDERLFERLERMVDYVTSEADGPEEVDEDLVEYAVALPEGRLSQIRNADDEQLYPLDAPGLIPWQDVEERLQTVEAESGLHRVLVQDVSILGRRYTVLLASSLESLILIRDRMITTLLATIPLALVLAFVGGLAISRRALKPVDEIAQTAADITVGNLARRLDVRETGDAIERLSRTFNEMLERLERSVARIEQFSADASHELRTPISVIRTTAELALKHGRNEEDYRSDLKDIQDEAERLSEVIDVLMSLSREGGAPPTISMADVDLGSLVESVCRPFEKEAASKGLSLELRLPEERVLVLGNEASLRRLTANLVENAVTHTRQGKIAVSIERKGARLLLRVKDTGEGIPEEALGRVFDRFYRVESSRSRTGGHFGLGLSIARRIAELHGAEITVESRPGAGSEFAVEFSRS